MAEDNSHRLGPARVLVSWWPTEQWIRNQYAVVIAVFVSFLAFTTIAPILPLYVQALGVEDREAASLWSGVLFGLPPLIAAGLSPVWGMVADRFGRKLVMQRSLLGFTVVFFLMAFAQNIFHLLGLRLIVGIFGGFGVLSIALVAASAPKEKVSQAIGTVQAAQILAQAVGPALGGFLADAIGMRSSFVVTAFISLLALVVVSVLYRERRQPAGARGAAAPRVSIRQVAQMPFFFPLLIVLFLVNFIDRSFGPQIPLYVAELGTTPQYVGTVSGLVLSLGAAGGAFSAAYVGRLAGRRPPRQLLLGTLVGGALFCLPIAALSSAWQLLVLRALLGLAAGGSLTLAYSLAGRFVPQHARSTGYATLGMGQMIGAAVSPMIAGLLATHSIRSIFVVDAGLYLLTVGWVLATLRIGGRESAPVALAVEGSGAGGDERRR